ncbi:MAG: ABC transporter permease [Roseburia sp.]|nr:ABC transporter permease [Roseburia sp.]
MHVFNIAVSSFALSLLCAAVTVLLILHHGENMIYKSLADDISMYGVARNTNIRDLAQKTGSDFIVDVYNAPEIDGVGQWSYVGFAHLITVDGETDYWNEILEIQNSHVREFDADPNCVQGVYMSGPAFHINDLELYQGNTDRIASNDESLIYLGYNFRDIPVGTVFVDEISGTRCVVEGVLQKNTSIFDAQILLWNIGGMQLSYSVAMDNMVLVMPPSSASYLSVDFIFKCSDGSTYEEAAGRIKSIAEEYGIGAETGTLQNRIDTVLSEEDWLINAIAKLAVLLSFSSFIMILTTQLLTILSRKDELGVWLISGIDQKKVFRILLGENMIKMFLASVISYGIVILFYKLLSSHPDVSSAAAYRVRYIIWGIAPAFLLVSAGVMALLCSVVPIIYIKKKSIPDIVRGTWE